MRCADLRRGIGRALCLMAAIVCGSAWLAALAAPAGAESGSALPVPIPLDHWSYSTLEELRVRGAALVGETGFRPVTRAELASALGGEPTAGEPVDPASRRMMAALRAEFAGDLATPASPDALFGFASFKLLPEAGSFAGLDRRERVEAQGELALGRGPGFGGYVRARVNTDGRHDLDYLGSTWRGTITAMVDYATLDWAGSWWGIDAGRQRFSWGPDAGRGLFLSGEAPSVDGVHASATAGRFRFEFLGVALDDIPFTRSQLLTTPYWQDYPSDDTPRKTPRFFSAHRLEWHPRESLNLGAAEGIVYGGPGRNWEPYYLLPFVPFYAEQWNHANNDNILVSLDAEWRARRGTRLFGELLIDDAQYHVHTEPQETGVSVGVDQVLTRVMGSPLLSLGYTRVNTWTYGQDYPWNRYTVGRTVLGDSLGPDADRWRAELGFTPGEHWRVNLEGWRIRHGVVTAETPRLSVVPFPNGFPSGVVERTTGIQTGVEYLCPPGVRLRLWTGGEFVRDRLHVPGWNSNRLLAGVAMELGMRRPVSFALPGAGTGESQPH